MAKKNDAAEQAVRDYLTWKVDPEKVQPDTTEIDQEIMALDDGDNYDPIRKLELIAERRKIADVGPKLREAFINNLKPWAESKGFTAEDLKKLPEIETHELREAGFSLPGTAPRAKKATSRAQRVSADVVKQYILSLGKGTTFTAKQIEDDGPGGSYATVTKAIKTLVGQNFVKEVGKDPDHTGQGAAPKLYEIA